MIKKLLCFFFFSSAIAPFHAQSDAVQDWIDVHNSGLVNFDFEQENEDSISISAQYLYGSVARAIGGMYSVIEPLSKELEVVVLATASAQDKKVLGNERNQLIQGLTEDDFEEFITMKNAEMDFTMYAIERGDYLTDFVFMMFTPEEKLRVINFQGRVHPDELYNLFSNRENLEDLISLGSLSIIEID